MKDTSIIVQLLETAWVKRREEKYDEARDLVVQAHKLCKEEDFNNLGRVFHVYMQFESDHDNHEKAIELCRKSLMYYKKANNQVKIAHSTRHIADLQYTIGNLSESERNYRAAIHIYRDNPNESVGNLANALRGFGLLLEKIGKKREAIEVWRETKELYQSIDLQQGIEEANKKLKLLR